MRFPVLPYLIAGTTIVQYAVATPLRVVVITSAHELSPNVPTANDKPTFHADHLNFGPPNMQRHPGGRRRRPCHAAGSLGNKAHQLANSFRKWLGFPVVEEDNKVGAGAPGELVEVLPLMPVKTYVGNGKVMGGGDVRVPIPPHRRPHYRPHHGNHLDRPFWIRVHNALMVLGPWEGRAVAFVLGCGIGVLLRMMFVMLLITYRTIRGEPEHTEYIEVVCEDYGDAESILVPPPQYICERVEPEFVDVKKVQVEEKDEAKQNEA